MIGESILPIILELKAGVPALPLFGAIEKANSPENVIGALTLNCCSYALE